MLIDIDGNELAVGDTVAYSGGWDAGLGIGIIVKLTPKCVRVGRNLGDKGSIKLLSQVLKLEVANATKETD